MAVLPQINNHTARKIFLERHFLSGDIPKTTSEIVDALGFVQLDSINTVSRAHHMILHARQTTYRDDGIDKLLKQRDVFEAWTHDASVISSQFYPQWRMKFERDAKRLHNRWNEGRRKEFLDKANDVLKLISDSGPCSSSDVGTDETRGSGGWWDWHPSKTALEYLWRSGRLAVSYRKGFRKFYDLTENVIAPEHLKMRMEDGAIIDWACNAALDRLGFASSGELAAFWDLISAAEAKAWCAQKLATQEIIEIEIEGAEKPFRSFARPNLLNAELPEPIGQIKVLSPFDPMLRDRKRAQRLFGFHYRIEVFVPEAKRVYGYYVFPVIEGAQLIGRVDAKCDRKNGVMNVRAFWPESGIRMGKHRIQKVQAALGRTARLAGTPEVELAPDWLKG
ncbi:MAG: crosslink repair DNA glycosylase YcaQ family protein [Litoreibacter sp.]